MTIAIITGGRDYNRLDVVAAALAERQPKIVICGGAIGADTLARAAALAAGIQVIEVPANWVKFGKPAGMKRNAFMADLAAMCAKTFFWSIADEAVELIAFPGGRGTAGMITIATERQIPIRHYPDGNPSKDPAFTNFMGEE